MLYIFKSLHHNKEGEILKTSPNLQTLQFKDYKSIFFKPHKTIIRYPHAGSRMYGVFPVEMKYFLPIKVLYWDTLFLARLHLLMRVKLVDELLWTRRDTPTKRIDFASHSQAVNFHIWYEKKTTY